MSALPTAQSPTKNRFLRLLRNPLIIVIGTIIVTLLVVGGILRLKERSTPSTQLQQVLTAVSKDIYLPQNETPALAVVTDPTKLQSSLASVAKKGDDVLVYQKNSQVFVYRPSTGKLVIVEPILIGGQPNPNLTATVGVLNGSGNPSNTQTFILALYKMYPNLNLVYKDTAPRLFPSTLVYGATADDSLAAEVAKGLNIQAGQAPLGVSNNSATLTFIIGEDYK